MAAARAIASARLGEPPVISLQELHANGVSGEEGSHDDRGDGKDVAAGDRAPWARARS
jgi:hypothetical protein